MTVPLIILAVLSTLGGFLGMPHIFSKTNLFHQYLNPLLSIPASVNHEEATDYFQWVLTLISVATLIIVYMLARNVFIKQNKVPSLNEKDFNLTTRFLYNKYYVDEFYNAVIVKPLYWLSEVFYKIVDTRIVDGGVNALGRLVVWGGRSLRLVQSGNIGFYIFIMVVSIIAIFLFNIYIK